jgi:hypothetical protein
MLIEEKNALEFLCIYAKEIFFEISNGCLSD